MNARVAFFDLHRLYLEQQTEIDEAVTAAVRSGRYVLGEFGKRFETALGAQLGTPGEVLGCNSGTVALLLSLRAAGVGLGDEVVTVSHTAIPTIAAVVATGARPVFVDVDAETWLVDPDSIARAVTSRTRAVIVVHLYGAMAPVGGIARALEDLGRTDVSIVEDVAQAHGGVLEGRQAGTVGRFGAFSFYPTKNIGALGDGGAVSCNRGADVETVRQLRNYGQSDRYHAELEGGINSRLDEVQAAVLKVRLARLGEWIQRKDGIVRRYRAALEGLPLAFQKVAAGTTPAWHLLVVACESPVLRERLAQHCTSKGVETLVHYPYPTHTQRAFREFATGALPETESLATRILSLPMNPGLRLDEQEMVVVAVRSFFG